MGDQVIQAVAIITVEKVVMVIREMQVVEINPPSIYHHDNLAFLNQNQIS